ncbi:SAM-dependent methyltransferase [Paenibacillus turicensis]|uniref:SAM-dependent methyltransferase n=1 Tax=Paenibacillus turicensis TaxID=160487 RepID=A0ABS4FQB7_9BACL|nr:class I SAM-dependent methyltransferase [Paenibacillus turicensis]MBP1904773.1 SAM-dependent methyltransferase [Paenibacillus turicensis]
MNRIQTIRSKEKAYHDHCYDKYALFEQGSWLYKPVQTILNLFSTFEDLKEINMLDLGCGVGRNSIPLAEALGDRNGKVVCVDLLESAIHKLQLNAAKFNVTNKVECVLSDIANFSIEAGHYDFIFAVSSLEHLDCEYTFNNVVAKIMQGTKAKGINSFIISTNVSERNIDSGEKIEPMYELNFETHYLVDKLKSIYENWTCVKYDIKPYQIEINRDGIPILLKGDVLTWVTLNEWSK